MELINLFFSLLKALILTIVIEGAVIFLITKDRQKIKHSIYCNLMTNPLLNLIAVLMYTLFGSIGFTVWIAVGETAVFISEGELYRLFGESSKKKAYMLSLSANMCSFLLGLVLSRLDLI